MKKYLLSIIFIAFSAMSANNSFAQGMAVNADGSSADPSAMLDIKSTTKGFVAPRMTSTDRTTHISSPTVGLLVYQTDAPEGYYYYSSGGWVMIPTSSSSSSIPFADFFALMFPDNLATVAVGGDVQFPEDGPNSGSITRTGPSSFNLPDIGTYQVMYQVSVTEPGQLILTLNGADLAYTVSGRATGTSQITGTVLVTTTVINSILTVRNPAGNSTALTITPLAGGSRPVSAHLVITKLQ